MPTLYVDLWRMRGIVKHPGKLSVMATAFGGGLCMVR